MVLTKCLKNKLRLILHKGMQKGLKWVYSSYSHWLITNVQYISMNIGHKVWNVLTKINNCQLNMYTKYSEKKNLKLFYMSRFNDKLNIFKYLKVNSIVSNLQWSVLYIAMFKIVLLFQAPKLSAELLKCSKILDFC